MKNNIHSVEADGECLFNAVAYGIMYLSTGSRITNKKYKPLAHKLRKETVKVLNAQIDAGNVDAIMFMSGEYNNNPNVNNFDTMFKRAKLYTKRMSKSCTWGGQIEIQALGPIVHEYGYRGIKVYNIENKKLLMKSPMKRNKNPVIHIVLHGVESAGGGGTHYDFWNKESKNIISSSLKLRKKNICKL